MIHILSLPSQLSCETVRHVRHIAQRQSKTVLNSHCSMSPNHSQLLCPSPPPPPPPPPLPRPPPPRSSSSSSSSSPSPSSSPSSSSSFYSYSYSSSSSSSSFMLSSFISLFLSSSVQTRTRDVTIVVNKLFLSKIFLQNCLIKFLQKH